MLTKIKFKKPKFWELDKPNFLAHVLSPFTIFIKINNYFLDKKVKRTKKDLKTICVGNIYIGGTGKTPTVIKLYDLFKKLNLDVSVGKKFYKDQVDEIAILKKKTKLISEKTRLEILNKADAEKDDILIFDDGLQDKKIEYNLEFVCFDSQNWVGNGCLIPSGPLREKLSSLNKYDAVFLKNQTDQNNHIIETIKMIKPNIKIFQTFYEPINIKEFSSSDKFLIFSGIGNPKDFKNILLKNNLNIIEEIIYPDHFSYTKNEIKYIKDKAKKINAKIITTEKDFVKILKEDQINIQFLRIETKIKNEKNLINYLDNFLNE